MPPKSIEIVYWAGATSPTPAATVAAIAEAIQETKAGGIQAYGTDTDGTGTLVETVTDDYGSYLIGFTRAEDLRLQVEYTLVTDSDYPGNAAFRTYISGWVSDNLGISDDVFRAKLFDIGFNVAGIVNITQSRLCWFGGVFGTADLAVGDRQIATLANNAVDIVII